MGITRRAAIAAVSLLSAVSLAACGGSASNSSTGAASGATSASASSGEGKATGKVTVLAAASLQGAFEEIEKTVEKDNPGLDVTFDFQGSQTLVSSLSEGNEADVLATADEPTMNKAVEQKLVGERTEFATNVPTLIVPKGNPANVKGIDSSLDKGLNKYTTLDTGHIISSVMVRVAPGADADAVAAEIAARVPGVSVATSTTMVSGIARSLETTSRTITALIALVWGVGLAMVTLVFVMMIVERRREFGTLVAVGAHKGLVSRIVLSEAVVVNAVGAGAGIAVSGILIVSFSGLVRQTIGLGFLVPSIPVIAGLAVGAVAAMGLVALVSSWIALRALNMKDASALLKEGE